MHKSDHYISYRTPQGIFPHPEVSPPQFQCHPSPVACPLFETRQSLQLGLDTPTHCPGITSSAVMQSSKLSSAANWSESARKSTQPQLHGTSNNRLRATLARNRADRRQLLSPHPPSPPPHRSFPPTRPHCPAKDRLLRWRPLLTATTSPSGEDLEKQYQLTALAWEPSTLTSYASGLLVFHTWSNSKGLPEEERAPVSQDTIASFITDLAGAYAGDTIANYVQGVRAWHRLYNIPWKIDQLHIQTMLKGARKSTPDALYIPKRLPLLIEDIVAARSQLNIAQPLDAAVFACLTTTFFTAARLGEFTVKRPQQFQQRDARQGSRRAAQR
jgi:hypothetical protein